MELKAAKVLEKKKISKNLPLIHSKNMIYFCLKVCDFKQSFFSSIILCEREVKTRTLYFKVKLIIQTYYVSTTTRSNLTRPRKTHE